MAEEEKKQSLWQQIKDAVAKVYNSPPLQKAREISDSKHSAPLWAAWRAGLKDLQNVALDPWNGVTAKHEEVGSIANPTMYQVNKSLEEVGNVYGPKEKQIALTDAPQVEAPKVEASKGVETQPAVQAPKIEPPTQEKPKMAEEAAPEAPAQGSPAAFDAMMAQHQASVPPAPEQSQEMER